MKATQKADMKTKKDRNEFEVSAIINLIGFLFGLIVLVLYLIFG